MCQGHWISIWARRRQDEVIRIPADYIIHPDFLLHMDKNEVQSAFLEINSIFKKLYGDIAQQPGDFGMPLHSKTENRIFSQKWRDSRQAPYRPFILLYNLFISGDISGKAVHVPIEKYKSIKPPPKHLSGIDQKIKQSHFLFDKLADYGFVFDGLKNNKPAGSDIVITYPDNTAFLHLFKQLADKAHNTNRIEDFLCCHFRLLQDDMKTANYGHGADVVADRVHTDTEKEICYKMDETLRSIGMETGPGNGIECYGLSYCRAKTPYTFRLVSRGFDFEDIDKEAKKMRLLLRIRNVSNCLEYLKTCPDSVMRIFTEHSDEGCAKRFDDRCKHGVAYEIDNKQYWRCACCNAAFNFKPDLSDIPHYIKLVELGEKK